MTTKVEELRQIIVPELTAYFRATFGTGEGAAEELDSLIAAANEEGCDDGWAASKMLWTRMQEWNKEWQKENPKERSLTLLDAMDLIEWRLAKARAEGAEQERERITVEGHLLRDCNSVLQIGDCSVLPTEELKTIAENSAKEERLSILSRATFLPRNFDARESAYFYGEREDNGDVDVLAREDCYLLPASVLSPAPKEEK